MLFMHIYQWDPEVKHEVLSNRQSEKTPSGVSVLAEWIGIATNISYRVIETDDPIKILRMMDKWREIGHSELIPIITTEEMLKTVPDTPLVTG